MTDADELLTEIQVGIDQATDKLENGRIRDLDKEDARLAYLSRLNDLAHTKFTILHNYEDLK